MLTLPDGEIWRFMAKGAQIDMADSVYLAYRGGPKAAHQITLSWHSACWFQHRLDVRAISPAA